MVEKAVEREINRSKESYVYVVDALNYNESLHAGINELKFRVACIVLKIPTFYESQNRSPQRSDPLLENYEFPKDLASFPERSHYVALYNEKSLPQKCPDHQIDTRGIECSRVERFFRADLPRASKGSQPEDSLRIRRYQREARDHNPPPGNYPMRNFVRFVELIPAFQVKHIILVKFHLPLYFLVYVKRPKTYVSCRRISLRDFLS